MVDTAVRAGYGFDTAMAMSPRQLATISAMHNETRNQGLVDSAIAARAAQADKDGWQKFLDAAGE